jgi:hypothetical protein
MVTHRLVELETETPDDVQKAIEAMPGNGYALDLVDHDEATVPSARVRARDERRAPR